MRRCSICSKTEEEIHTVYGVSGIKPTMARFNHIQHHIEMGEIDFDQFFVGVEKEE